MQVEPSTRFANRALDSGERFLRRRPLYPAELRDHTLESPYFARLSRLRRLLTVRLGVILANLEGRFLISFSNFGGRTFSHLLILAFGSGASE